jgi:hypothetical protein
MSEEKVTVSKKTLQEIAAELRTVEKKLGELSE